MSEGHERSRALPMIFYKDPALAYERTEAQTCQGCQHETTFRLAGQKFKACDKNRRHGKRCKFYRERAHG